jgi:multidrug efflux pump subunit AcrA (membrane-fusion protein)
LILKDNFASFAKGHSSSWAYRFSEDKEGRALAYEARMKKLEALRKEEEEARKRHDEKVAAEKKAAREREEQAQIAAEQAQARQQQSSGGGSSVGSVMKTVGTIAGIAGAILSFL